MRRTIRDKVPAKPSTRLTQELERGNARVARAESGVAPDSCPSPLGSPSGEPADGVFGATPKTAPATRALPNKTRDLIHLLRGDLDWIVMKALEKDRTRRYETANGLARDLQRHLNNEPVVARPASAAYRVTKFVRRNKPTVTAITIIATVLVLGLFVSVWEAIRAKTAQHRAQRESARALGAEKTAIEKSQIAETQRQRAIAAAMEARQNLYAADMSVAQRAVAEEHDLRRARTLLDRHRPSPGEPDLRGFEWRRLWQLCQNDVAVVLEPKVEWPRRVVVSFDGKLLAASKQDDGPLFVWDTQSWRLLKTLAAGDRALAFAPRKPLLVTGGSNGLKVWNTTTWSAQYLARCHLDTAAVFSDDGRWLVVHGDDLQLWDTTTWTLVASNAVGPINGFRVPLLACAPDGSLVSCGSGDPEFAIGEVHLLRLPSLQPLRSTTGLPTAACCLTFTPDSRQLVVSAWDKSIRIWELATWKEIPSVMAVPSGNLLAMAFSPTDPNLLATCGNDGAVRLWDFAAQKEQLALYRGIGAGQEELRELAFSPDGSWLAVGGVGNPIMIFSARTRKSGDRVANHQPILRPLAFSSDSRQLLTLDATGQLAFWDADARDLRPSNHSAIDLADSFVVPGAVDALPVAVSPDLHWLAVGGGHGQVRLWNLETKTNHSFTAHAKRVRGLGFSADSRKLATVGEDSLVRIWNLGNQDPVASLPLGEELPDAIWLPNPAFSADGRFLVANSRNTVKVWDATSWTELKTLREGEVVSAKFSPEGRTLVISYLAQGFDRWDTAIWTKHHLQAGNSITWDFTFSPDGRRLASMAEKAILWDTTTWEELASFKAQTDIAFSLFSPDGNKLALCEMSGGLRLLCAPSLQEIESQETKRGRWP